MVACWYLVPSLVTAAMVLGELPLSSLSLFLVTVAVVTGALLLRRQHPVAVLIVIGACALLTTIVAGNPFGHEFGVVLAIYTTASLRPPQTAWVCTLASIVLLGATTYLLGDMSQISVDGGESEELSVPAALAVAIGFTTLWIIVAHAIGTSVRARRSHERDLADRTNRLALERDQREQLATAAERARIAREMHDVIAHSVSVMVALADGAAASLDKAPDRTRTALTELSQTGRDALAEIRSILGVLRSEDTDRTPFGGDAPLAPTAGDLDELLTRFRAAGLPVERVDTGPPLPQQPRFTLTVYRVVQEALTNVLRYAAGASAVRVEIGRADDVATVVVSNDAGSGVVQPGSGNGLVGLRERVGAFGGTVTAGPHQRGWRVRATIPIPTEEP